MRSPATRRVRSSRPRPASDDRGSAVFRATLRAPTDLQGTCVLSFPHRRSEVALGVDRRSVRVVSSIIDDSREASPAARANRGRAVSQLDIFRLDDRVALIPGGGGAIGSAMAVAL